MAERMGGEEADGGRHRLVTVCHTIVTCTFACEPALLDA